MNVNNNKFVVEEIKISAEEMHQLNSELKRRASTNRPRIIRKYAQGNCGSCFGLPTKKILYDIGDGMKFVVYYCQECFDKNKKDLDKRLENMNFT